MTSPQSTLGAALNDHTHVITDPSRSEMIQKVLDRKEAYTTPSGALITWNPDHSTGRSPADTYIVKQSPSAEHIDWTSKANNSMDAEVFDSLWADGLEFLKEKKEVFVLNRVVGSGPSHRLPTKVVTDRPLSALFADNMFREVPDDLERSFFADDEFQMIVLPYDRVDPLKYKRKLRHVGINTSDMVIAMDFDRKLGLVIGSSYCGCIKKLMFTVMNYLLPEHGILPLHCAANEDKDGNTAAILGLSGTGKTTLSADPERALLGDDEHGWSDFGISNFEGGCYAKLIDLNPEKEPEIYRITFGEKRDPLEHGCIIENAMMYPDGHFDLSDTRLTANSRVSYPLDRLSNVHETSRGGHPKTILFLTADANGVLPPVAKLSTERAMLWFLMGYTSKLAGTETGVKEPKSTFSRFFGEPFMPRNPSQYINLLQQKLDEHGTKVYLVNTGWTGGPYGVGKRIDINVTRAIVNACLSGEIEQCEMQEKRRFHLAVPKTCPGVDPKLLDPKSTWTNPEAYRKYAKRLAFEFADHFDRHFSHIDQKIKAECPGK